MLGLILESVNGIIFYHSFLSYIKGYHIEKELEKIINEYWFILKYGGNVYSSGSIKLLPEDYPSENC